MKRLMACLLLATSTAKATTPADYAAVFPITTTGIQAAWLIDLDVDVYRWSQDENLRDIAVFNAAGNPVPLGQWNEITPIEVIEDHAPAPLLSLPRVVVPKVSGNWRSPTVDGSLEQRAPNAIEVRPSHGSRPNREWLIDATNLKVGVDTISLDWSSPRSGVFARFDVFASSDVERWMTARHGATVMALEEDGARIDRREIKLDLRGFSYFRLVRTDSGPDLVGLHAEVSGRYVRVGAPAPVQWVDATYHSTVNDDTTHEIQWRYDLPAALPVSELRVGLLDDNALAHLQVLSAADASDGSTRWSPRAEAVAYRLRRGDDIIESAEIPLTSTPRTRSLRMDSKTPLAQPPRLSVGFRPQRIVFLAEGEGPYVLAVGSRVARHPDYPVSTAIEQLREYPDWHPQTAKLGSMQTSAGERAIAAPVVARTDAPGWKRWLLWGVLIGSAAVVGGIAVSLLRTSSQCGAEDRQQPPEE
jgi:hypothetical protein